MIIRQLTEKAAALYESTLLADRSIIERGMGQAQSRAAAAELEAQAFGRSLSAVEALLEEVRAHRAALALALAEQQRQLEAEQP